MAIPDWTPLNGSCLDNKYNCDFHEKYACFGPLEEKDTDPGTNTQTLCVPADDNCQGDFVEYTADSGDGSVEGKTFVKGDGAKCTYAGRDDSPCQSDMDCDALGFSICTDMAY